MKPAMRTTLRLLVTMSVLALIAGGVYGFGFYLVKKKNERTSVLSGELARYELQNAGLNAIRHSINTTQEERTLLDSYFLSHEDTLTFTRLIESLDEKTGTEAVVTTLDDKTKKGSLVFSIQARGSFQNLFHLLATISHLPYKVVLRSAHFGKDGGGEDPAESWTASFSAEVGSYIGEIN